MNSAYRRAEGGGNRDIHDIKHRRILALLVVFLSLLVIVSPAIQTDASPGDYYSYTIHPDGTVDGGFSPIGSSSVGPYTSVGNTNSGS